VPEEILETHQ